MDELVKETSALQSSEAPGAAASRPAAAPATAKFKRAANGFKFALGVARQQAEHLREAAQELDSKALAELMVGGDELAACSFVVEALRKVRAKSGVAEAPVGKRDLAMGVYSYAKQQTPKALCHTDAPTEDVADLQRWMLLSAITYGRLINWSLGLFRGPTSCRTPDAFLDAAAETCGCSVLMHSLNEPSSGMYKSAYTVFDARGEEPALVVAIRGTSNIREVLTDLVCTPLAVASEALLPGGEPRVAHVHEGMWRAACSLAEDLREPLRKLLEQRPAHQVVLTGHSLGAGVACLLCLCWRPWLGARVRAVGFATPQVLDAGTARAAAGAGVTSVVAGSDVVPRLSLRSAEAFAADVAACAAERRRARVPTPQLQQQQQRQQPGEAAASGGENEPTAALFPAGKLLLLDRCPAASQEQQPVHVRARQVDQEAFASIRVSRSMLTMHMQTEYLHALGVGKA